MLLTTQEVAEQRGMTRGRIIQLIHDGTIPATKDKFSRAYQINEKDLESVKWPGKRGRPRKEK